MTSGLLRMLVVEWQLFLYFFIYVDRLNPKRNLQYSDV